MLHVPYGHFGMLMGRKGIVFAEKPTNLMPGNW